jgi:hypothetical protein
MVGGRGCVAAAGLALHYGLYTQPLDSDRTLTQTADGYRWEAMPNAHLSGRQARTKSCLDFRRCSEGSQTFLVKEQVDLIDAGNRPQVPHELFVPLAVSESHIVGQLQ